MDNRLDHRTIVKWQRESARLLPLMVRNEFADAEPLIPSRDGFVLTADNRLAFQFMLQSQAQKHGMDGLTPHEAYALMGRLENMPRIEAVALEMQRDLVVLRRALVAIHGALSAGRQPTIKEMSNAYTALKETEF